MKVKNNIKTLEKLLKVKLTPTQQSAWQGVRWLLDNSFETIATGRSTVTALAFISIAMANANKPIHVFDHHWQPRDYGYRAMEQVIKGLLSKNKTFAKQFKLSSLHQELVYIPKKKVLGIFLR